MFSLLEKCMLEHFSRDAVDAAMKQVETFHFNMSVLQRDLFSVYS